jgi:hypothetical protein
MRWAVIDHRSPADVGKAHLDQRISECAEVSAEPLVLLTTNHDDILLAVVGAHKLEQPGAIPRALTAESPRASSLLVTALLAQMGFGSVEDAHGGRSGCLYTSIGLSR